METQWKHAKRVSLYGCTVDKQGHNQRNGQSFVLRPLVEIAERDNNQASKRLRNCAQLVLVNAGRKRAACIIQQLWGSSLDILTDLVGTKLPKLILSLPLRFLIFLTAPDSFFAVQFCHAAVVF